MKVTVEWISGGKTVKVEVECDTALLGWEEKCARKVQKAVEAMEKVFPRDKETNHGKTG